MKRSEALKLRALIERASEFLTDKEASEGAQLFPRLKNDGALIKVGTRINWVGTIKRAAVDLWDTENNNPDNAPNLWEDIAYINGIRIIPETITVALAFEQDELGYWNGNVYRSKQNNNVYTPIAWPDGWERVECF